MICQVQKYVKLSRYILAAALLGSGAVLGQNDQTVEIVSYAHDPCEVIDEAGFRQLIYPRFAQHGGKSKSLTSKSGYWNCDTRLNAGIQSCKDANSAPRPAWGVSEDVLQSCDAMFETVVSACVSHYEGQRHKCEAYSRDSGNGYESAYASALDNVLEANDYQAALGDLDKKAAQRLQRQEEERKRQAAEAKRLEEKRIAKAKRDQAEQERIARLEAEWAARLNAEWEEWETEREARRRRANSSSGFNTLMNSLSNAINQGTMNAYEKLLQQQQATQQQEANRYTGINGEVCDEILYSKLNLSGNPANKEITRKHLQDAGCKPGAGGIIWLAKMNAWGRNSKSVGGTQ